MASTAGTALGGLVHVAAGAIGISALIVASAQLFGVLKFLGAIYLIWLGIRTFREARHLPWAAAGAAGAQRSFAEGVLVEALNPKTAAFFLAFMSQFIDPASGNPALQFAALGLISVVLNSTADLVVVLLASATRRGFEARPHLMRRLRQGSGLFIAGLGIWLALTRRPVAN